MIIQRNSQKYDIFTNGTVEPVINKPGVVLKDCIWCLLPAIKASNLDGFNKKSFYRCHPVAASAQVHLKIAMTIAQVQRCVYLCQHTGSTRCQE